MNRRDLLKRLPALPIAVASFGPTVTQAIQRASTASNRVQTLDAEPYAERLKWAVSSLSSYVREPDLPFPEAEAITVAATRAVIRWEAYADSVRQVAQSYSVEISDLLSAAGRGPLPV